MAEPTLAARDEPLREGPLVAADWQDGLERDRREEGTDICSAYERFCQEEDSYFLG